MSKEKKEENNEQKKKKSSSQSNSQQSHRAPNKNVEQSFLGDLFKPLINIIQFIVSLIGFDSFFGIWMSIVFVFLFAYSLKFLFTGGRPERKKRQKKQAANEE